ncbi:MAG: TFIIB-type zinc ribbon-containing protein [Defluviitaleaceae bacterium]|nr:TFIIB-type zinc ribbon-containing protein [Defluviitaleaceae bacterium]
MSNKKKRKTAKERAAARNRREQDRQRLVEPPPPKTKVRKATSAGHPISNLVDGKCFSCGYTDISLNIATGNLRCGSCQNEYVPAWFEKEISDIKRLSGTVIDTSAADIETCAKDVLTFECGGCGAEVIVDTTESLYARCHWCRSILSVSSPIPNGAVPDKLLPFSQNKEDAQEVIRKFARKRRFFAHPQFKRDFTANNVMGVYLPYMAVDVNASAKLHGVGERNKRRYEDDGKTYYEVDSYNVSSTFQFIVEDLTIESNSEKLRRSNSNRTNNIVNAIKPFDMENCVEWNTYFMRGFTSQRRDTDVSDLSGLIELKVKDIAKHEATSLNEMCDRGIRWDNEELKIAGTQWRAVYLPVWLYSYSRKKKIHYVAVNGRNLEVMGSIPINWALLLFISSFIQVPTTILGIILILTFSWYFMIAGGACLLAGPIFIWHFYEKYRNPYARYKHESDAFTQTWGVRNSRKHFKNRSYERSSYMSDRNDWTMHYQGK